MIKSYKKILLMSIMLMVCASGCSTVKNAGNITSETDTKAVDENFKKNYNTLMIDGQQIELPIDYDDFISLGFSDSSDPAIEIKKGKPIKVDFTKDENTISGYIAYDGKNESGYKIDSSVVSVFASKENAGNMNISFYKGIDFNSSESDVSNILEHMDSSDGNSLYGIKISDYEYLSVSFTKESVNDIMVINGKKSFTP